jgi:hypothetical protein
VFAACSALASTTVAQSGRASGQGASLSGPVGVELARVESAWKSAGSVELLQARLVVRGQSLPLVLPAAATDPKTPACATLLALSAAGSVFSLSFEETGPDQRRDFPLASSLGLVEISRCGARKAALAQISIQASSPRVVVSLLTLVGEAPGPSVLGVLPRRQAGQPASAPELGARPKLGPLPERLMDKQRLRAAGRPGEIVDGLVEMDALGHGSLALTLAAGCHTLDVLDASTEAGLTDVDARLIDLGGTTWALDASVAPDAALSVCLGEQKRLSLDVRGAAAGEQVAFLRASWPLPDGLPTEWGPSVRGRLAEALRQIPSAAVLGVPLTVSLGVQGTTRLVASVQPGRCYVAAVAALDREPERLGLAGRAGGSISQTRTRPGRSSAAISLCATGPLLAVDVESVGAGISWLGSIWELEDGSAP